MSARASYRPLLWLVVMTIATFGGPLVFGLVLRGGPSRVWPPDRPIEWWTLGLTSAVVLGLMIGTITASVVLQRRERRARAARAQEMPQRNTERKGDATEA